MKKTVSIMAVALAFLLLASFTFADKNDIVDLSKLSDEELISLHNQVQQEIVDRHIEKSAKLVPGSYLVGKDIPAGNYIVNAKYDSERWWMDIEVYADGGDGEKLFEETVYSTTNTAASKKGEATFALTLNEGELFKFDDGEITLTVSTGIKFE